MTFRRTAGKKKIFCNIYLIILSMESFYFDGNWMSLTVVLVHRIVYPYWLLFLFLFYFEVWFYVVLFAITVFVPGILIVVFNIFYWFFGFFLKFIFVTLTVFQAGLNFWAHMIHSLQIMQNLEYRHRPVYWPRFFF